MAEPEDRPANEAADTVRRARLSRRVPGLALVLLATLLIALGVFARVWVATDAGRAALVSLVENRVDTPVGRIGLEGVQGDPLGSFSVARLTLKDARGVWLEARGVRVRWAWPELALRRVEIQSLQADRILVSRAPIPPPAAKGGPSGSSPVSLGVERYHVRLQTAPEFSVQPGDFLIDGQLELGRKGGVRGDINARSLLRQGDGLVARFNWGWRKRLLFRARAVEVRGGAIAGLAGLPADQAFQLDAEADGAPQAGRLRLDARSAGVVFARADGAWDASGGAGHATAQLGASKWTRGLLKALGPQVTIDGRGRGLGPRQYDLTVSAVTENARIRVAGPIDADRVSAIQPLAVEAQVGDFTRIIATPAMSRVWFRGRLDGRKGAWNLAGDVGADRLAALGASLNGVLAKTRLARSGDTWRVTADAAAQSGQGAGIAAALVGGRPKANIDLERLSDGRLLVRGLDFTGAAITVSAKGRRGVLGGLSLDGTATLPDLRRLGPRASGGVRLAWNASERPGGAGWGYAIKGSAERLALADGPLGALLGASPDASLEGSWSHDGLRFDRAALKGAEATATGKGAVSEKGVLTAQVDAAADASLAVGSLVLPKGARVSLSANGDVGRPEWKLVGSAERLRALMFDETGVRLEASGAGFWEGGGGEVEATGRDASGAAHLRGRWRIAAGRVQVSGLDALAGGAGAQGDLGFGGAAPIAANLSLAVGPGVLLKTGAVNGRLALVADGPSQAIDLDLSAKAAESVDGAFALDSARLTAKGPLGRVAYSISAAGDVNGPASVNGSGLVRVSASGGDGSFSGGGTFRSAAFRTEAPAEIRWEGEDRSVSARVGVGGGDADVFAERAGAKLTARGLLRGVDLALLDPELIGKASGAFELTGDASGLSGSAQGKISGARSRDATTAQALGGEISATLAGGRAVIHGAARRADTEDGARIDLSVPVRSSAAPFLLAVVRDGPISGRFSASGEIQPLWDLFYGGEQSLGGELSADGAISGTTAHPAVSGRASLLKGRFDDAGTGLKLRNLTAAVTLSETAVTVSRFDGQDSRLGAVSGSGRIALDGAGDSTLRLDVKYFQLLDNDVAKATATGTVTVTRRASGDIALVGQLGIDQATISANARSGPGITSMDVIERNKPGGSREHDRTPEVRAAGPGVALDISLKAGRRVFVKGLGLNAELSLDAKVGGSLADPQLSGMARVVRGDYEFAGKRFEIDDQGYVTLASSPERMRLDLTATWDDASLTAVINIGGTAAKPEIKLTSTPALPQDEVLSEVLFGSSAAQLSPVEAAQLAAAVTALATGGGFDVMGGLSRFARLDRLALGGDQTTGVTVSGGKYIGNSLYLELTGGGRQPPSAQLEYRANRSFSIVSQVGGLGGAKMSVRWRHDYGHERHKPAAGTKSGP